MPHVCTWCRQPLARLLLLLPATHVEKGRVARCLAADVPFLKRGGGSGCPACCSGGSAGHRCFCAGPALACSRRGIKRGGGACVGIELDTTHAPLQGAALCSQSPRGKGVAGGWGWGGWGGCHGCDRSRGGRGDGAGYVYGGDGPPRGGSVRALGREGQMWEELRGGAGEVAVHLE